MQKITYPHKSRAAQVEYICGIGGYYGSHNERWPIVFNVKCYVDVDFDTLWDTYHKEFVEESLRNDPVQYEMYYQAAKQAYWFGEQRFWDYGIEEARRSVTETDIYSYLPDGKTKVDVQFGFAGRSGGYLVLDTFEGYDFRHESNDELRESMFWQTIRDKNGSWMNEYGDKKTLQKGGEWEHWSTKAIRKLYKYLRGCEVWFSSKNVDSQVQYYAAYLLFQMAEDKYVEMREAKAEHEEIVEAAKVVFTGIYTDVVEALLADKDEQSFGLLGAFYTMAKSAGLSDEEIKEVSQHLLPLQPHP